jgi:EAL domain-containing protein (putative c-di-GMP-specific phosphodiesterase class I)
MEIAAPVSDDSSMANSVPPLAMADPSFVLDRSVVRRRRAVVAAVAVVSVLAVVGAAVLASHLLTSSVYRAAEAHAGEDARLIVDQGLAAVRLDGALDERDRRLATAEFAAVRKSHPLNGLVVWTPAGEILYSVGDGRGERPGRLPAIVRKALASGRTQTGHGGAAIEAAVPLRAGGLGLAAEFHFSRAEVEAAVNPGKRQLYLVVAVAALLLYLATLPLGLRLIRRLPPPAPVRVRRIQALVQDALANDRVRVHYQPKVDLRTGAIVGVEALVRLEDPSRGLLVPADFLPAVEQAPALFAALSAAVIDQAVGDCSRWTDQGLRLPLALNVGAESLGDGSLQAAVMRHRLDPRLVTVEITERAIMTDDEAQSAALRELRALGIRISIDDFGTGYSSLSRLRQLPLDEVKIDRSFVSGITADARAHAVVRLTVQLAREHGLAVVAEGVEDAATIAALTALGCGVAQGYLFSHPLPEPALLELLRQDARAAKPSPVVA